MDSAYRPALKLKQYVSEIGSVSVLKLKIKLTPAHLDPTSKSILNFWAQRLRTILLRPHTYDCVHRSKRIGRRTPVKLIFVMPTQIRQTDRQTEGGDILIMLTFHAVHAGKTYKFSKLRYKLRTCKFHQHFFGLFKNVQAIKRVHHPESLLCRDSNVNTSKHLTSYCFSTVTRGFGTQT